MSLDDKEIAAIRREGETQFPIPNNPDRLDIIWAYLNDNDPAFRDQGVQVLNRRIIARREGWIAQKVAEREKHLKREKKVRPVAESLFKRALSPIVDGKKATWDTKFPCTDEKPQSVWDMVSYGLGDGENRWDPLNMGDPDKPIVFMRRAIEIFTSRYPMRLKYCLWAPPPDRIGASPPEYKVYTISFEMAEDAFKI